MAHGEAGRSAGGPGGTGVEPQDTGSGAGSPPQEDDGGIHRGYAPDDYGVHTHIRPVKPWPKPGRSPDGESG